MSADLAQLEISPRSYQPTGPHPPMRFLGILALLIFSAEIITMVVLFFLPTPNYFVTTLLDGSIMLALILPGLYFLQLKPLLQQIEERNRAQDGLRASENLLRKSLESLPVGVWIIDRGGRIVHGNPASQEIWGGARYVGMEQYGEYKGWWADTGKPVEPEEWAAARAIACGETSINEEIEIEIRDGVRKIILNSALPIWGAQRDIQGAIVVNEDITVRKMAEKELIRTNELLERSFASIDTLIAYLDRECNFIRVNDTYARSAGHPPEYFTGKNHFDLYPHDENQAIFRQVVETGEPYSVLEKPFEYLDAADRGVTYWDWSLQPVKAVNGDVEGLVLSLVDVTERKRAELQLERQNEELRRLFEAESTARQTAETLSAAALALTQTLELDHVADTLLEHIRGIVDSDTAGVTLLDNEMYPAVRIVRGYDGWAGREDISFPIDGIRDSVIHRMKLARKSLIIPNAIPAPGWITPAATEHIANWLIVPIVANEELIGFLELGKAGTEPFTAEQRQWVEALVVQAAVAIQNAWLFEQVRSGGERLQALARKLVEVQENERYHIARELHDEAGQALSSLKLGLGRLEQDCDSSPRLRQQISGLKGVVDGVLDELHRLALNLRPVALDRLGLVAALDQYANNLNSDRLTVQFKAVGFEGKRLSQDAEITLYRIVQEALTNVVQHARAGNVGILLELSGRNVKVFVEDDGIGFAPDSAAAKDRLGLIGMHERAEMFAGTLAVESLIGKGTSIIVELPNVDSYPDRR